MKEKPNQYSRREFLIFGTTAIASATVLSRLERTINPNPATPDLPAQFTNTEDVTLLFSEAVLWSFRKNIENFLSIQEGSYSQTSFETALLFLAEFTANSVMRKMNVPHGNKSMNQEDLNKIMQDPVNAFYEVSVLAPLIEEFIFRLAPTLIDKAKKHDMRETGEINWKLGIPSSIFFALAHNAYVDENGQNKIAASIPLSQFFAGLYLWYAARKRGISHSVVAHGESNGIALTLAYMLQAAYPVKR